jgi:hypothetical protein
LAGNTQIVVPRTPSSTQPNATSTKKSQKRYTQTNDYDPNSLNTEFDYVHERLNQIAVGDPALDDLPSTATMADLINRVNALASTMRKAGLLRSS